MTWNPFRKREITPSDFASALAKHGAAQRKADHRTRVIARMHQMRKELGLPPVRVPL